MDLVGAISNLSTAQTLGQVQMQVARKILDNQRLQGAAAVELIQAASEGVTQAGDALVAQATGLGGMLDVKG